MGKDRVWELAPSSGHTPNSGLSQSNPSPCSPFPTEPSEPQAWQGQGGGLIEPRPPRPACPSLLIHPIPAGPGCFQALSDQTVPFPSSSNQQAHAEDCLAPGEISRAERNPSPEIASRPVPPQGPAHGPHLGRPGFESPSCRCLSLPVCKMGVIVLPLEGEVEF